MITVFVLLLLVNLASLNTPNYNIEKTVSVFSKHYERVYDVKIKPFRDVPCTNSNTLKLEEMNLGNKFLKDNLIHSDSIQHISLRGNNLTNISAIILNRVRNLICLDISENKFNLNNNNFIEHGNLKVLNLCHQKPDADESLKSEGEIIKKNEKYMEIKVFNTTGIYLPNLEHLFLCDNNIVSLPDTFNISFPKLSHIYLNNIDATNLNKDFFNKIPKTLRVVHLEDNKLYNLILQNITEIIELYLDGNPLTNIEIVSKKLNILSLSHGAANGHINLYTPYLEYLDLSHNNLQSQPDIRYNDLQFLKTLLLDYNEFSSFPLFTFDLSLIRLSLSYNKLTYIASKYFQHLTSLKMLSLRGNRIRNIESDTFKHLSHLEFLDLSQNQLIKLPNDWIIPLQNIQFFNASSNYFITISDITISPHSLLTHLFVEDNTFMSVTNKELDMLPNGITVYLD
ncbi:adenylate cyclase-like [Odontomachus brunneus]|uniref:adenylate cyclase-like n=1 Tax=Odontomachus brunneus TaxID=486640 RepID=UPI0013F1E5CC|nr:adenylate cyclase-like [Odontomachus brunneus]